MVLRSIYKLVEIDMQYIKPKEKNKVYVSVNMSSITVGLLLAGVIVASVLFFGFSIKESQYASQNQTVPVK